MPQRSSRFFDLARPSPDMRAALAMRLSPEARRILLNQGTEPPFCGGFVDYAEDGVYVCGLCGLPLFESDTKFHSASGWPSFYAPLDRAHIRTIEDDSHGMRRVEIRCARCDAHLGHVFPDGPPPTSHRYCLNSVALTFVVMGEPLPDLLGRGEPEGRPLSRGSDRAA